VPKPLTPVTPTATTTQHALRVHLLCLPAYEKDRLPTLRHYAAGLEATLETIGDRVFTGGEVVTRVKDSEYGLVELRLLTRLRDFDPADLRKLLQTLVVLAEPSEHTTSTLEFIAWNHEGEPRLTGLPLASAPPATERPRSAAASQA